jgi:hypothetical protein
MIDLGCKKRLVTASVWYVKGERKKEGSKDGNGDEQPCERVSVCLHRSPSLRARVISVSSEARRDDAAALEHERGYAQRVFAAPLMTLAKFCGMRT